MIDRIAKQNRKPVRSSNIAAIGYYSEDRVLEVEFRSGSIYRYFEVSDDVYRSLMGASSHGKYLIHRVAPVYRFAKVRDAPFEREERPRGGVRLHAYEWCYERLGVSRNANLDELRRAYHEKAKRHHPDVGGSEEMMKLTNEAYQLLRESILRNVAD